MHYTPLGDKYLQNNKIILFTGAGFTKNFGGLLADEMWSQLFNHDGIQNHINVKNLMINKLDYEYVYQEVLNKKEYDDKEKKGVSTAIRDAYKFQENRFPSHYFPPPRVSANLNVFINKHVKLFFTINHDLFAERHINKLLIMHNLNIPGLPFDDSNPEQEFGLPSEKTLRSLNIKDGGVNYFKLHGSINWLDSKGKGVQVIIGKEKLQAIYDEPILKSYYEFFREILKTKGNHLLIIGYSFSDKHINLVIHEGIKKGLKVHIVDTKSPKQFKEHMDLSKISDNHTRQIWYNLAGYFPITSLNEFFDGDYLSPDLERLWKNLGLIE